MSTQTLKMIPKWARIITENNHEKIEITFRKVTLKEQQYFEKMPLSQKKQLSLYLYKLKMLMVTKSLKGRYEFLKAAFKAFHLTVETYEEFKKRKLKEADEQI